MPEDIRININNNDDLTVDDDISIRENAVIPKRPLENTRRSDYRPINQASDNVPIDGLDLLMNPKKRNQSDTESIGSVNSQERRNFGPERPSHNQQIQPNRSFNIPRPVQINPSNEQVVFKKPKHDSRRSAESSYRSEEESRASTPMKKFIGPEKRHSNRDDASASGSESSYHSGSGSSYTSGSGSGSGSYESGSSASGSASGSVEPRKMSYEELLKAKQTLLYDLEKLDEQGYHPSKRYNMTSDYEEMKAERDKLKKQRDTQKSIRFQRKMLTAFVSGIEFLNGKFDPFDIKLDGWTESVMENVGDYDEVFEELHEKYKEKVKMAPEIKLIMMVGGSAFMFHLTNTLFKSSMPGLNDILKQNPNIMRSVQEAAMNQMSQNPIAQQDPAFQMMRQGMRGMNAPAQNFEMNQMGAGPMPSNMNGNDNEMMGPSGVDDILAQLDRSTQLTPPPRTPTPPHVNIMKKKPIMSKKKQGGIAIDL